MNGFLYLIYVFEVLVNLKKDLAKLQLISFIYYLANLVTRMGICLFFIVHNIMRDILLDEWERQPRRQDVVDFWLS